MVKIYNFEEEKMARARYNPHPIGDDWRLDKTVSIAVIISLLTMLVGGLAYAISFKEDLTRLKDIPERVAKIETQVEFIKGATGRIETYIIDGSKR